MSRDPFRDGTVWAWLLAARLLVVAVLWLLSCGPGAGPTVQMARTVRFVVEAQCSDLDPVKECLDKIDQNAAFVDHALDGGR